MWAADYIAAMHHTSKNETHNPAETAGEGHPNPPKRSVRAVGLLVQQAARRDKRGPGVITLGPRINSRNTQSEVDTPSRMKGL